MKTPPEKPLPKTPDEGMPSKALLRALRGEASARPPFWLMRQAGRYLPEYRALRTRARDFLDFCFTPEMAVEATLQPIRRYGMDAAILFSDILVVPHALGQKVAFKEGVGPVLEPVRSTPELAALSGDAVTERLSPVYEAVRILRRTLPAETALIGFAGAPWTVATYMVEGGTSRDHATTRSWAFADSDGFGRLIDLLVDATVEHLAAQCEAGVDAVQLFDTWAGALPESAMRRWCLDPAVRIAERLAARHPDVPMIVFPRGVGVGYAAFAEAGGFAGLGLDGTVPLRWAAETLQPRIAVQGNLDPLLLVAGGAPMRAEVARILDAFRGGPFVFNLGHGVVPQTPPDHVRELTDLIRSHHG